MTLLPEGGGDQLRPGDDEDHDAAEEERRQPYEVLDVLEPLHAVTPPMGATLQRVRRLRNHGNSGENAALGPPAAGSPAGP